MKSGPFLVEVDSITLKDIERGIRNEVFIKEQNVPHHIEFDEFEDASDHFLIENGGKYIGCIRYRWSGKDIKIERLAILKEYRNKGYGHFAMRHILKIIQELEPGSIYLHSQVIAKDFYKKCEFETKGPVFKEADIDHVKMYYIRRDQP